MLMQVSQYKPLTARSSTLWVNYYVMMTLQTRDHMNACVKAVCRTVENHVITRCTICHHASEVGIPR